MQSTQILTSDELGFSRALSMFCLFACLLVAVLMVPLLVHAASGVDTKPVSITEIMYDPPGTDSGHEWVEVQANISIDVSKLIFREEGVGHKVLQENMATVTSAGAGAGQITTVPAGSLFIIADDPAKFRADHPHYSGLLFNSTFSLKNTGERLGLEYDGQEIDMVQYNPELGGKGDGSSLQNDAGTWFARVESPGTPSASAAPVTVAVSSPESPVSTASSAFTSNGEQSSYVALAASIPDAVRIEVVDKSGRHSSKLKGNVGIPLDFFARGFGIKKAELQNARFIWNFGDGMVAEGEHIAHVYRYPGVYQVAATVSSGVWSDTERLHVVIEQPAFFLERVSVYEQRGQSGGSLRGTTESKSANSYSGQVRVKNTGLAEAHLDGYMVVLKNSSMSEEVRFVFAPDTAIAASAALVMPFSHIVKLEYDTVKRLFSKRGEITAELRYPNGKMLHSVLVSRVVTEPYVAKITSDNTTVHICHYE